MDEKKEKREKNQRKMVGKNRCDLKVEGVASYSTDVGWTPLNIMAPPTMSSHGQFTPTTQLNPTQLL